MKAIRKPEAKRGAGELETQGLQVGRPLPWALPFGVQRTARPTYLYRSPRPSAYQT